MKMFTTTLPWSQRYSLATMLISRSKDAALAHLAVNGLLTEDVKAFVEHIAPLYTRKDHYLSRRIIKIVNTGTVE